MPRLTNPGLGSEEARPPRQLTKLRAGALATSLLPSANAGVDHASPSHRLLRAGRKVLTGATSQYDQGRSKTDGRGEIRFAGLPTGDLRVLSLDPGWTIETPGVVVADETYIEWTAKQRLGERLKVFEASTNKPVERAAATFGFECTFADGETMDMSQWVGRGNCEVTFVFDPSAWDALQNHTIVQAVFYGTARAEDGQSVDWIAEPLENPDGTTGVAEVGVEVPPEPDPAIAEAQAFLARGADTPPEPSRLLLDVRYPDGTPFEGEQRVAWNPTRLTQTLDRDTAKPESPGRYLLDVLAGDLTLEVSGRNASGSFQPCRREVTSYPNQAATVFLTLPRGASATIPRPTDWRGEWWVTARFKLPGDEEWRGSTTWSTADNRMTLDVLRPAEWKFELRRESSVEPDPVVRTVALRKGNRRSSTAEREGRGLDTGGVPGPKGAVLDGARKESDRRSSAAIRTMGIGVESAMRENLRESSSGVATRSRLRRA